MRPNFSRILVTHLFDIQEEIQKLAAQIEFMKIVHMEMNNRHVKPKVGGYFTAANTPGGGVVVSTGGVSSSAVVSAAAMGSATVVQSPMARPGCLLTKPPDDL